MNRIESRQHAGDDGVARLVIRDHLALADIHHALLLEPGDQAIDGVVEFAHLDRFLVPPRREKRRFVDQIREIGAREAGRALRDDLQVDVRRHLHLTRVDAENLFAAADVGLVHEHLAIETAGAEQRRVAAPRAGWSRP